MGTFRAYSTFFIALLISGCLTYRSVEYVIEFAEDFKTGRLVVTYTDIRSSETDPQKQKADFLELINLYEQDQFLLDQVAEGVYVRERQLYAREDTLIGSFSGIFEKLSLDGKALERKNNERFLLLELSSTQSIQSDGNILRSKENVLLSWPADQKKIWFRITETVNDTAAHSIMAYYNDWKK